MISWSGSSPLGTSSIAFEVNALLLVEVEGGNFL
jgi:hypothetical protein